MNVTTALIWQTPRHSRMERQTDPDRLDGNAGCRYEYVNPTAESEGWQHCLTVPREVTYKNGNALSVSGEELNGAEKRLAFLPAVPVRRIPVNGPFDLDVQVKGRAG